MSNHTPRPWKLDPSPVTYNADKDEQLYVVDGPDWGFIVATDLRFGDARLIAAAPDLLDALEDFYNLHDGLENPEWKGSPLEQRAAKAIAKAKGETE